MKRGCYVTGATKEQVRKAHSQQLGDLIDHRAWVIYRRREARAPNDQFGAFFDENNPRYKCASIAILLNYNVCEPGEYAANTIEAEDVDFEKILTESNGEEEWDVLCVMLIDGREFQVIPFHIPPLIDSVVKRIK